MLTSKRFGRFWGSIRFHHFIYVLWVFLVPVSALTLCGPSKPKTKQSRALHVELQYINAWKETLRVHTNFIVKQLRTDLSFGRTADGWPYKEKSANCCEGVFGPDGTSLRSLRVVGGGGLIFLHSDRSSHKSLFWWNNFVILYTFPILLTVYPLSRGP